MSFDKTGASPTKNNQMNFAVHAFSAASAWPIIPRDPLKDRRTSRIPSSLSRSMPIPFFVTRGESKKCRPIFMLKSLNYGFVAWAWDFPDRCGDWSTAYAHSAHRITPSVKIRTGRLRMRTCTSQHFRLPIERRLPNAPLCRFSRQSAPLARSLPPAYAARSSGRHRNLFRECTAPPACSSSSLIVSITASCCRSLCRRSPDGSGSPSHTGRHIRTQRTGNMRLCTA